MMLKFFPSATRSSCCSSTCRRGFTLLELMVAIAISLLVLATVVKVVVMVLGQTERSIGMVSRFAESNKARDGLASDLQGLYAGNGSAGGIRLRQPGFGWGIEGWSSVPTDGKPSATMISETAALNETILNERWGREGVQAAWFLNDPLIGEHDPGGLKSVSYQMKRKQVGSSSFPRYYLMRSEVSALQVFENGYVFEDSAYEKGTYSETAYWSSSVVRHPNANHIVASNVIDFGMRVFVKDVSTSQWQMVFPNSNGSLNLLPRPCVFVVMLRVLSDEGAEKIENIEQGRVSDDWWETALRYSEVVSFQVEVI